MFEFCGFKDAYVCLSWWGVLLVLFFCLLLLLFLLHLDCSFFGICEQENFWLESMWFWFWIFERWDAAVHAGDLVFPLLAKHMLRGVTPWLCSRCRVYVFFLRFKCWFFFLRVLFFWMSCGACLERAARMLVVFCGMFFVIVFWSASFSFSARSHHNLPMLPPWNSLFLILTLFSYYCRISLCLFLQKQMRCACSKNCPTFSFLLRFVFYFSYVDFHCFKAFRFHPGFLLKCLCVFWRCCLTLLDNAFISCFDFGHLLLFAPPQACEWLVPKLITSSYFLFLSSIRNNHDLTLLFVLAIIHTSHDFSFGVWFFIRYFIWSDLSFGSHTKRLLNEVELQQQRLSILFCFGCLWWMLGAFVVRLIKHSVGFIDSDELVFVLRDERGEVIFSLVLLPHYFFFPVICFEFFVLFHNRIPRYVVMLRDIRFPFLCCGFHIAGLLFYS